MSSCSNEPAVVNSKDAVLTNKTGLVQAYYECLSGFTMSGNQTISCNWTLGTWDAAPSCSVIQSDVYVYTSNDTAVGSDNWWTYFMAAFLLGLLAILLAFLIWCCCWAPRTDNRCCARCCCRDRSNTMPVNVGIYRDSIFWAKGHDEGTKRSGRHGLAITAKDSGEGHSNARGQAHSLQNKQTTPAPGSNSNNHVTPVQADKDAMSSASTGRTPREAPVYRAPRPAKDPARDLKLWMPHSNNVRDINTSTK